MSFDYQLMSNGFIEQSVDTLNNLRWYYIMEPPGRQ